ncbi:MAG: hypothetical protein A3E01_07125 [Gammaproteobacteria bacterium RIFCSPHIGHO2_12_FULL_63_22]|nr:MAG: hypothetical protein A3E01_07125 [Gammaproteobacteria bacterium RIFCSPHIGHO2_12_FULL_63_22]
MPDQYGNATPQEVLAQITAERDQIMGAAQGPDERRLATLFSLGRMMMSGQDPRLLKAQAIENAQREVQELPRGEEESELSYTRRLTSALADRLRDVDPSSAAAARVEAKKLESEEQNRRILMQQETMQEQAIAANESDKTLRQRFEDMGYVVNLKTGDVLGQVKIDDPEYAEKVAKIVGNDPTITDMPYEDMLRIVNDPATAMGKQVSVQQFGKLTEEIDQNYRMGVTVNQLYDIAEDAWVDNQNTVSDFSAIASKVNAVVGNVAEAMSTMKDGTDINDYMRGPRGRELYERARNKGITESLMVSLAYMFAMARNDRVTDADLEAAVKMLGGQGGDIRVALATIDAQMANQKATWGSIDSSIGLPPDQGGVWSPGQFRILSDKSSLAKSELDKALARGVAARARTFEVDEIENKTGEPPVPRPGARNWGN